MAYKAVPFNRLNKNYNHDESVIDIVQQRKKNSEKGSYMAFATELVEVILPFL